MKYLKLLFVCGLFFTKTSLCSAQDCESLSQHFTSYSQAVYIVEHYSFKFSESVNTSSSSWVQSAHYYSCDGYTGYLVLYAKGQAYIHQNVPVDLWNEFKNAVSFGGFYNENIKGRFQL